MRKHSCLSLCQPLWISGQFCYWSCTARALLLISIPGNSCTVTQPEHTRSTLKRPVLFEKVWEKANKLTIGKCKYLWTLLSFQDLKIRNENLTTLLGTEIGSKRSRRWSLWKRRHFNSSAVNLPYLHRSTFDLHHIQRGSHYVENWKAHVNNVFDQTNSNSHQNYLWAAWGDQHSWGRSKWRLPQHTYWIKVCWRSK